VADGAPDSGEQPLSIQNGRLQKGIAWDHASRHGHRGLEQRRRRDIRPSQFVDKTIAVLIHAGMLLYQAYGVPWKKDDINEGLKAVTIDEYAALTRAASRGGAVVRWNGSLYYPAKIPDLIGIKDRRYIDHTATHLHRGIGDLMRYAALVSFTETADFGPYHMLLPDTKRVQARLPDEALYALALYIYSLQPPSNPNPFDEKAKAGEKIFPREGCPLCCHTSPLYTSNKLTLAQGFTPPKDVPATLDILPLSVGTDPGLALLHEKGPATIRCHHSEGYGNAGISSMMDPWQAWRRCSTRAASGPRTYLGDGARQAHRLARSRVTNSA